MEVRQKTEFFTKGVIIMKKEMSAVKWKFSEKDFEDLYKNEMYDQLIQLSEENGKLLYDLYTRKELEDLRKSIKFGTLLTKYFDRLIKDKIQHIAILSVGKLEGYLELLERLRFTEEQDRMVKYNARHSGTKHLDDIIFALETHGNATQTELSKILGLQASTLSEALKKIRLTGLIQVAPYGKYKMYSLTDDGIRYGALIRKKKYADSGPEYLKAIEILNRYIADESTKEECLKQLKANLNIEGQRFIGSGDKLSFFDLDSKEYEKVIIRSVLSKQSNSQEKIEDVIFIKKCPGWNGPNSNDNNLDRVGA